jgi:phenylalanyl-tRNA synthetase alpha chain
VPIALTPEQVAHDLAIRDLTDPSEGAHALQLLVDDASAALSSSWGCALRTARGPRIVALADNYDRLRFPWLRLLETPAIPVMSTTTIC